jgi:FkbM family methyltransferase
MSPLWMKFFGNLPTQQPLPAPWLDQQMVYADVGARGGPPSNWMKFKNPISYICFEPDPEEAAKLRKIFQEEKDFSALVIEKALGSKMGTVDLHLTRFRPSCSILEPNTQLLQDLASGHGFEVEKKIPVQVTPLDSKMTSPPLHLDFLKVDVQGYELEVLKGATRALDQILGCELEVSFIELYKNQPLFAEIDQFMRKNGFFLADIERFWWRRNSMPLNLQERGTLAYGNAFYLKENASKPSDQTTAIKASIICSAMGLEELSWEIVENATESGLFSPTENLDFQGWIRNRRSQTAFWFQMGESLRLLPGRRTLARCLSLWSRALEGNSHTGSDAQSWNRKTSW